MTLFTLLLLACTPRVDLPDLGPAPPFSLTDQHGQPLGSEDLRGRVLVADFIFTRCPHACPMLTQRMVEVADATAASSSPAHPIELVSFSVDPTYDTPEVLKAFAAGYAIAPERWHLLTGPVDQIDAVALGFMQGLERADADPVPDIKHSQRLLLIDGDGRLRMMAETDPASLERLEQAAIALAR